MYMSVDRSISEGLEHILLLVLVNFLRDSLCRGSVVDR